MLAHGEGGEVRKASLQRCPLSRELGSETAAPGRLQKGHRGGEGAANTKAPLRGGHGGQAWCIWRTSRRPVCLERVSEGRDSGRACGQSSQRPLSGLRC